MIWDEWGSNVLLRQLTWNDSSTIWHDRLQMEDQYGSALPSDALNFAIKYPQIPPDDEQHV